MGMTIDDTILCLKGIKQYGSDTFTKRSQGDWQNSLDTAIETMRKYQQLQADYENRLKADMVAMLTDIQLEIEELDLKDSVPDYQKGADETREYIADLLQQKIDAFDN